MLGLVNYGASDSEDEISDEEDVTVPAPPANGINKISSNIENDLKISSRIQLPQPKQHQNELLLEEDDDEFLHKKATPSIAPPKKKEKVKIFIPKLSDFKDDEDDDDDRSKKLKVPLGQKKSGLISMLPKPSSSFAPAPKPKPVQIPAHIPRKQPEATATSSGPSMSAAADPVPKKVGFIPYRLMAHAQQKPAEGKKKKAANESDSDDDDNPTSFFSFASSNDEELPKVSDAEVRALVEKEQSRIEERKRQHEQSELDAAAAAQAYYQQQEEAYQRQQQPQIDQEAMRALLGGNKAKRMRTDNIEILELNADQVMPDREEWMRRSLAGETGYIASGKINEKGPSALSKRKHQISYLSMRAENNQQELEAMWAANRASSNQGRNKYGF